VDDSRHGRGSIQIWAVQDGAWVELRVEDDGMGLSEQELSDVRQFIPGKTSKPGGTGFGLPIAQRYVSFHGGTVEIESVDGKGTIVAVRLPLETRPNE
jgi:signal transduction histidine kinase